MSNSDRYLGLIDRYRDFLPINDRSPMISLAEGNTPLLRLANTAELLGKNVDIYVKLEGSNPTGSFKDRGMTMAVSKAVESGSQAIICASTGNTSASAAAYAARAGLQTYVLIPEGKIAMGKLAQAMMYGAHTLQIKGNFDDGMRLVKAVAQKLPITLVNSVNPYRLQGQKTIAFEVVDSLGRAPDYHCLPVGNAGNISAHWMGYQDYYQHGKIRSLPKMLGYQAAGAAPFLRGQAIENPETVATAIRIGNPQSWDKAVHAQQSSGGWFAELSDEVILQAQYWLARHEGVFCEPASAASLAGAMHDIQQGHIPEGSTVVCTLTGNGLKDPDTAIGQVQSQAQVKTIEASLEAVESAIA